MITGLQKAHREAEPVLMETSRPVEWLQKSACQAGGWACRGRAPPPHPAQTLHHPGHCPGLMPALQHAPLLAPLSACCSVRRPLWAKLPNFAAALQPSHILRQLSSTEQAYLHPNKLAASSIPAIWAQIMPKTAALADQPSYIAATK